ncbi:MAG: patatin-like phospholipase family protein [Planctomycetaceae bacterium]
MSHRLSFRWLKWGLAIALLSVPGCALSRRYGSLELPQAARLVELAEPSEVAPRVQQAEIRTVSVSSSALAREPSNVLVLSGGGANGAYTAGVLNGWTEAGNRPQFDVVTGISTGALIAPFAFLGSEHDELLKRNYTESRDRDIFTRRWLPALVYADSLADSAPLRKRIANEITPDILKQIAAAHREGRRLYVGTTDLDTKRLVVWDLGAIADGNDPNKLELFRDVLLASASVPGLLPPVEIDIEVEGERHAELHVDGGVAASLFLQPAMLGMSASDPDEAKIRDDLNVYVIVAGQLRLPRRKVQRKLSAVIEESVGGVLQAQMDGDLLKTYLLSRWAGASFALTAVPRELAEETSPLVFDPRTMQKLFDVGFKHAATKAGWQNAPLSLSPEEQVPPRGSVQFKVEEPRAGRELAAE